MFSFQGHEGSKRRAPGEGAMATNELVQSTLEEHRTAGRAASKALTEYGSFLSFSGHEGGLRPQVDILGLERDKMRQEEGEQRDAVGRARRQLKGYDLLSFHDQHIARQALAHEILPKLCGQGSGGRGRSLVQCEGHDPSEVSSAAAVVSKKFAKAAEGSVTVEERSGKFAVPARSPAEMHKGSEPAFQGSRTAGLHWNGKGIPRFD